MDKSIIWLGVGGVALYFLYEGGYLSQFGLAPTPATTSTKGTAPTNTTQQQQTQTGGATNTSGTNSTVIVPTVPAPGGNGTVAQPSTIAALKDYVHQWALLDSNFAVMASGQYPGQIMATPYHWQYYLNMGAPGLVSMMNLAAAFSTSGVDLSLTMTEGAFWAGITPQLQMLGMSGLGNIAYNVNPYLQGPRSATGVVFGAGLAPTGMETYRKYLGQ